MRTAPFLRHAARVARAVVVTGLIALAFLVVMQKLGVELGALAE
jgi:hypothetical protein